MHSFRRKSLLLSTVFMAAVLAGCGGTGKAPVSTLGGGATSAGQYVVQRGDTLYSISRRHNVSVAQLKSLNNIPDPSQLVVGQRLNISSSGAAASSGTIARAPAATSVSTTAPTASDASLVSWAWPIKGNVITGYSSSTRGIDIAGNVGDPVYAAASGTVSYVGNGLRGLGNLILITHGNGFITAYAHNSKLLVKDKQRVSKGEKIAEVGQSDTSSPRLHFEIRRNGQPVNPLSYLPK
ncbi:peptidoglycan DD-metalloendopeptidase family protein [Advenella sp. WQ 585]|uniref:Peptidoglycan DD-metalloendopeptidase family protein n=2 Tax=Advenella mandrilli TaxID=2800330 RepID=A0ABS1EH68_9BURK|nr:peptidoglycan DD-metalloendopeptidase family protein [Advenella mandrilli]